MKIIIDHKIPFIAGAFEDVAEVVYLPGNEIGPGDVKDADALIIRTRTKCDRALLEDSTVKFIASATIGYDHIDTGYCDDAGIRWTNAPGCNSSSVEQYLVSVLLHLNNTFGIQVSGKTIGIVGVGNVGSKVARAAEVLGLQILLNDPPRAEREGSARFTPLEELVSVSDIVTMHVPLTMEGPYPTHHLAGKEFFSQMKSGSVFINTSRGEVVEESSLKAALHSGKLSHAVLDVFENEPEADPELLSMLTLATPHIAGYSTDGKVNGTTMSVQAVSRFFNLGKDSWQPSGIPLPDDPEIFVDDSSADPQKILQEVYNRTYDVTVDHHTFLASPVQFEKLRGNYRNRREPGAYHVRVFNDDGTYGQIFEG